MPVPRRHAPYLEQLTSHYSGRGKPPPYNLAADLYVILLAISSTCSHIFPNFLSMLSHLIMTKRIIKPIIAKSTKYLSQLLHIFSPYIKDDIGNIVGVLNHQKGELMFLETLVLAILRSLPSKILFDKHVKVFQDIWKDRNDSNLT